MDARAAAAREHHRAAAERSRQAAQHRQQRDDLVRALYADGGWTYVRLAAAVGCSWELVAKIVKPQNR